ncbi:MAG: hypothetical protein ACRDQZ_16100, partial [Mycobacteriales bacterium]
MTDIDGTKAEQLRDALGDEYLSALTGYIPQRSEHQRALDVVNTAFPGAEVVEQSKPGRRFVRDA